MCICTYLGVSEAYALLQMIREAVEFAHLFGRA